MERYTIVNDENGILTRITQKFEEHWYIPIPFTKRRLIFSGLRYVGWYTYK